MVPTPPRRHEVLPGWRQRYRRARLLQCGLGSDAELQMGWGCALPLPTIYLCASCLGSFSCLSVSSSIVSWSFGAPLAPSFFVLSITSTSSRPLSAPPPRPRGTSTRPSPLPTAYFSLAMAPHAKRATSTSPRPKQSHKRQAASELRTGRNADATSYKASSSEKSVQNKGRVFFVSAQQMARIRKQPFLTGFKGPSDRPHLQKSVPNCKE